MGAGRQRFLKLLHQSTLIQLAKYFTCRILFFLLNVCILCQTHNYTYSDIFGKSLLDNSDTREGRGEGGREGKAVNISE